MQALKSWLRACYERDTISRFQRPSRMTTISARVRPFHFTDEQAGAIKGELDSILSSAHFAGSKRCCEFLEFIVLHALEGDLEKLNERFLGTELFGRPVDYETATDAIVRVRANDVRRRLAEFYSESQSHSKVKIAVNSGTYIPEFQWRGSDIPEPTQPIPFNPLSNLPKPNPAGGGRWPLPMIREPEGGRAANSCCGLPLPQPLRSSPSWAGGRDIAPLNPNRRWMISGGPSCATSTPSSFARAAMFLTRRRLPVP